MHCEPPPITFIPCEAHFRPVLPTIEGNVDYLALREQLTTIDELLRTSGVEKEFVRLSLEHWIKTLSESKVEQIELSGEGQSGVIGLEDLVSGKQQVRFQEHSVRALRCSIARTLLVGSFRDFAARLADSPLLQWFCQVARLDRVKVPAKSTIQRYSTWLPEEDMREVINGLLRKAGAAITEGKQVLDLEEPLDLVFGHHLCESQHSFSGRLGALARRSQEPDAIGGTDPHARTQITDVRATRIHHQDQPLVDGNDSYPAQEEWAQRAQAGVAGDEESRERGARPCPALPHATR